MKLSVKTLIKKFLKASSLYPLFRKYKLLLEKEEFKYSNHNLIREFFLSLKFLPKIRIVTFFGNKSSFEKKAILFQKTCRKIKPSIFPTDKFVYDIDPFILPLYFSTKSESVIGNLTVNYTKVLEGGFEKNRKRIVEVLKQKKLTGNQIFFLNALLETYKGIKFLRNKYLKYLKDLVQCEEKNNQNIKELHNVLSQVPLYPARSFREALQAFLFVNSLVWLEDHRLIGLGRLDQILYPYFNADLKKGILRKREAYNLLKEFLRHLHTWYKYKSNVLLGDTGQVIVLGGKNIDGSDASNDLTFIIMDALKELKLPDPKIILRIHSKTPDELWSKALECLISGLQYPLFSNDEVIIPALIEFGYSEKDAFDYVTSACWEPLIPGKSLDQNNISNLNFLKPLHGAIEEINKKRLNIKNFDEFFTLYKENLKTFIKDEVGRLNEVEFEPSPLLSLLTDNCLNNLKDISVGGAEYNNYGLLSVGIGNVVNALLNIERVIFQEKKYSFEELENIIKKNFLNSELLLESLRNKGAKFCTDNEKVIFLTNELIETVSNIIKNFNNKFGGKFKFGLSSPAFISVGRDFPATLDGRRTGNPFGVNISPLPFGSSPSYTEIANFASRINYKLAFNGSVLDLMVEKSFLKQNEEKFINFLKTYFQMGGMQVQFNILDYNSLIAAKKNPELFPNLIVRPWGFCAYFKDLPEEYQNLIIERAQYYESISNKYSAI